MRRTALLSSAGVALALLACCLSAAAARELTAACSPFVYPCNCGLCPNIVNCETTKTAECFCGKAKPGTYAHPSDSTKFWMCSYDKAAKIPYGVEIVCPSRLVFDPVAKVCTLPSVAAQSAPAKATITTEKAPAPAPAPAASSAPAATATTKAAPK